MKNADVAWTAFALVACSSTTYARVAPVEPPGPIQPHGASPLAAPLSSGKGRVVVESFQGHTSALEESAAGVRLVCPSTPCFDDVAPGAHRYWFVPKGGTMNVGRDGVVLSKDGAYPAPVETKIYVGPGETILVRAALGRTEVRRTFPPARAIGWVLFAAGLAIAALGAASSASAPSASRRDEAGTGLAEFGVGTLTLGGALWLSNWNDSVTLSDHPGVARQLRVARPSAGK